MWKVGLCLTTPLHVYAGTDAFLRSPCSLNFPNVLKKLVFEIIKKIVSVRRSSSIWQTPGPQWRRLHIPVKCGPLAQGLNYNCLGPLGAPRRTGTTPFVALSQLYADDILNYLHKVRPLVLREQQPQCSVLWCRLVIGCCPTDCVSKLAKILFIITGYWVMNGQQLKTRSLGDLYWLPLLCLLNTFSQSSGCSCSRNYLLWKSKHGIEDLGDLLCRLYYHSAIYMVAVGWGSFHTAQLERVLSAVARIAGGFFLSKFGHVALYMCDVFRCLPISKFNAHWIWDLALCLAISVRGRPTLLTGVFMPYVRSGYPYRSCSSFARISKTQRMKITWNYLPSDLRALLARNSAIHLLQAYEHCWTGLDLSR